MGMWDNFQKGRRLKRYKSLRKDVEARRIAQEETVRTRAQIEAGQAFEKQKIGKMFHRNLFRDWLNRRSQESRAGAYQKQIKYQSREEAGAFGLSDYQRRSFAQFFKWVFFFGLLFVVYTFFSSASYANVIREKLGFSLSSTGVEEKLQSAWYTLTNPMPLLRSWFTETYGFTPVQNTAGSEVQGIVFPSIKKNQRFYENAEIRFREKAVIDSPQEGGDFQVNFQCLLEPKGEDKVDKKLPEDIVGNVKVYAKDPEGITNEGQTSSIMVEEGKDRSVEVECVFPKIGVDESFFGAEFRTAKIAWSIMNALTVSEIQVYHLNKDAYEDQQMPTVVKCIAGCGFVELAINTLEMPLVTGIEGVTFPLGIYFGKRGGWNGGIEKLNKMQVVLPVVGSEDQQSSPIELIGCDQWDGVVLDESDAYLGQVNVDWKEPKYFLCEFSIRDEDEEGKRLEYDIIRAVARYDYRGYEEILLEVADTDTAIGKKNMTGGSHESTPSL